MVLNEKFKTFSCSILFKDGGRLYNGAIFLTKLQCAVLDSTEKHSDYLNSLIGSLFPREVLEVSSVTGEPSNRSTGKFSKLPLDPVKLNLIYGKEIIVTNLRSSCFAILFIALMADKTNHDKLFNQIAIKKVIAKKINNLTSAQKRKEAKALAKEALAKKVGKSSKQLKYDDDEIEEAESDTQDAENQEADAQEADADDQ